MSQPDAYILHCSVSASVRQSIQIKFEDYKLPEDVIETLKKANSISIRPNLSSALKLALDEIRLLQRYLYDRCTIHHGDVHFLHPDHFDEAMSRISEIRDTAKRCNERINEMWSDELEKWTSTVDNFFSPLITDPQKLLLVREAYLQSFPTKQEFLSPIQVHVVGPYPAVLERVDEPTKLTDVISNQAAINTAQVLEAAKAGARDSSYGKLAELLDDLDARPANKVGDRCLSTNPKKRGSWQIIFTELSLASAHNPGLKGITKLVGDLIDCGSGMRNSPKGAKRMAFFKQYAELKEEIRDEVKSILNAADSSKGFDHLQKSMSLTNQFKNLLTELKSCESVEELERLKQEATAQTSVFKHRAKKIEQALATVSERITARSHLATTAEELKETTVVSVEDCDF